MLNGCIQQINCEGLERVMQAWISGTQFSSLILIALISISMFMLLRKKIKVTLPVVLAASLNLF